MPRYDYECDGCGERVERSRTIAERQDTELCECGGVRRLAPSAPGIAFKGTGWTPKGNRPAMAKSPLPRRTGGYDMRD